MLNLLRAAPQQARAQTKHTSHQCGTLVIHGQSGKKTTSNKVPRRLGTRTLACRGEHRGHASETTPTRSPVQHTPRYGRGTTVATQRVRWRLGQQSCLRTVAGPSPRCPCCARMAMAAWRDRLLTVKAVITSPIENTLHDKNWRRDTTLALQQARTMTRNHPHGSPRGLCQTAGMLLQSG